MLFTIKSMYKTQLSVLVRNQWMVFEDGALAHNEQQKECECEREMV